MSQLLKSLKVPYVKNPELQKILWLEKNVIKTFACLFLPLIHVKSDTKVLGLKMNYKVSQLTNEKLE